MNLIFYSHIYNCFGIQQYMLDGLATNAQITTTTNMPDGLAKLSSMQHKILTNKKQIMPVHKLGIVVAQIKN